MTTFVKLNRDGVLQINILFNLINIYDFFSSDKAHESVNDQIRQQFLQENTKEVELTKSIMEYFTPYKTSLNISINTITLETGQFNLLKSLIDKISNKPSLFNQKAHPLYTYSLTLNNDLKPENNSSFNSWLAQNQRKEEETKHNFTIFNDYNPDQSEQIVSQSSSPPKAPLPVRRNPPYLSFLTDPMNSVIRYFVPS
ncbi:hypothetical protein L3V79_05400 [Thiotrichales bacterium 19S9-12]|nr:hypothetical protein [Thiotrichales bacterium 19S9-11]MCF6811794.1 hypothetical protein [Thiotrichales bacterium 19S9-12]